MRAADEHGDFGIIVHAYRTRWFAQRRLKRCRAELAAARARLDWTGQWDYYIRETP